MSSFAELYESLRRVRTAPSPINDEVTVVTAYVGLDDVPAGTEHAFARRSRAMYQKWMRSTLSIRQNMVVFADPATESFVTDVRRHLAAHTLVQPIDVEALRSSTWHREVHRIIESGCMAHATRPNRIEMKTALYNTIMFSKFRWVRRAIELDPFRTRYFLWMDAGFGHGLNRRFRYRTVIDRVWPHPEKNDRMKNTVLVLGTGLHLQHLTPAEMLTTHNHIIAGTIWGGDRAKVLQFCDLFEQEVAWTLERNLLDDDQSVMSLVWQKHPELFTTIDCSSRLRGRCHFLKFLDAPPATSRRTSARPGAKPTDGGIS